MEERVARVRWKPSMGTYVAGGGGATEEDEDEEEEALEDEDEARALMRDDMICASVVLPAPCH